MDEKIAAVLRVTGCTIAKLEAPIINRGKDDARKFELHEVIEMKATGHWSAEYTDGGPKYPASLHITVYPGCGAVPVVGDHIKITVEQFVPELASSTR